MKKTSVSLATVILCSAALNAQITSITLSNFGSSVEASSGLTWNAGTNTVSGTENNGELLAPNNFTSANLTTLQNYSPTNLRLNLTGFVTTAPSLGAFTITLEGNGSPVTISTPFNWNLFSTTSSTVSLPLSSTPGGFSYSNIVGWSWDTGNSQQAFNATWTGLTVTAVPEPSTYALMALSGLALFFIARRRKAQV
jgi:hypothetical protein